MSAGSSQPSRAHWLVAAVAGLAACHPPAPSPPAPTPVPAAPACPAPIFPGIEWLFVDDSTGFTLALPPRFQERPSGGPFRHWELVGDFQQSISFGLIRGELGLSGYRRAYQPTLMLDYSECSDGVDGYRVAIQAWRTPRGVFRNYRRLDRYDVFAIWEVSPGVYAYLAGGTYDRSTQELMLAAIRSWRPPRR